MTSATSLVDIFEGIHKPSGESSKKSVYAVLPVPGRTRYYVGKDSESLACLLVLTSDRIGRPQAPIRWEGLDVQFEVRCHLRKRGKLAQDGIFTVIRCRESDGATTRYFLSICDAILLALGDDPTRVQIAKAVNRLAAIFQRIRQPPARPLNGLFGELYVLLRSGNAVQALRSWRVDQNSRFDFANGDVRMDVKVTTGRIRAHTFSYEQCNPPARTIAIIASMYAEQIAGGSSLRSVVSQLESRLSGESDLVLKLHETVAATLGTNLSDGLSRCFDIRLAEASLQFFDLNDVPAIRGTLPAGVSDVRFRADLSRLAPLSVKTLVDRDPTFRDLLPRLQ